MKLFKVSKSEPEYVKCSSLEELVISNNKLTNRNMEELSAYIKSSAKSKLQRLDLSQNGKISVLGVFHIL